MSHVISPSTSDNTTEGRASRPLQVAEAMKQFVVSEGLQAGDKLPSEAELMALFGMAKGTIREATRILEAQGLVKTRTGPGGGCFVHEVSETRTRALLSNYFYFRRLTIRDIYQLRKQLEPELVAELAGKLDESAIAELHAITEEYKDPPQNREEDRLHHEAALRFHASLARHSKNQLLGFIIGFMAEVLSEVTTNRRLFEPRNTELWAKGREFQLSLLTALKQGDPTATRKIMSDHMEFAETLMLQQEVRVERKFGDL
jgi:DNA-binding FadR family transcriptional regulator